MDESPQQDQIVYRMRKQSEMKKIWERPKLIVLLKGRLEESVLAGCKFQGIQGSPQSKNTGCQRTGHCNTCDAVTAS
jgi:ferredoxin